MGVGGGTTTLQVCPSYALVAASVAENPVFSGQVGIGVEVPTATLDVAGRINGTSLSLHGAGALEMPGWANVFVGGAGNGGTTTFQSTLILNH